MNIGPRNYRSKQEITQNNSQLQEVIDTSLQHNIEYGKILEVDLKNSRVKVERQNGEELKGTNTEGEKDSKFFPLLTPLTTIHLLYGPLVPGLRVKIHWIGKIDPRSLVVVEVISNIDLNRQDFSTPEMERGFGPGSL